MPQYMDVIKVVGARALRQSIWFPYDICLVFISISYAAMSIFRGPMLMEGRHALFYAQRSRPNNPSRRREFATSRFLSS
jgi:hypothetical protein